MFLPRPRACLERQSGYVEELGNLQKRGSPEGRVVIQRLGEVPCGACHDEEVVVSHVAVPDLGVVLLEEMEEMEAVVGAGVVVGAVEVAEGVEGGVVREEDGVGFGRVVGEARVLEHAAVEDEFKC